MTVQGSLVVGVDLGTSGVRAVAFDQALARRGTGQPQLSCAICRRGDRRAAGHRGNRSQRGVYPRGCQINPALPAAFGHSPFVARPAVWLPLAAQQHFAAETGDSTQPDNHFTPAGPAWLWADNRAAGEARRIAQRFGTSAYLRTGCPVHASYWPAKLLWWREHGRAPFATDAAGVRRMAAGRPKRLSALPLDRRMGNRSRHGRRHRPV